MSTLMMELDSMIQNLERVRDLHDDPPDELLKKLDQLYEIQIKLIAEAINETTHQRWML